MFFPHFPLTLFFLFCLLFSFSYARNKNQETPQCKCDCPCAHNNSHANIPTNPSQSSPAHNNSHENILTNPSQSSPAHNNGHENIPIKPGNSPHVHDNSHEVPAKPGNSPPAHDNSQELPGNSPPAHDNSQQVPGNSPPAHDKSQQVPGNSPPAHDNSQQVSGNSPPAHDNSQEVPSNSPPAHDNNQEVPGNSPPTHDNSQQVPGNSPPAHDNSQEVPGNSPPAHDNNQQVPGNSPPAHDNSQQVPGNSPPAHDNSQEVPGNSPPAHDNSQEVPGNSPPAHDNSQEVPAKPGNSSPANNNSHDTSTRHNNYIGCFQKVFAFGDSYTDTGNANLLEGHTSSSSEKIKLCDGHLMVDFLCDALKLPHLPPFQNTSANFQTGANFAVAGSTILSNLDFTTKKLTNLFWKGVTMNFQTQIDWFNKLKQQMGCTNGRSCQAELENALFWIGSVGVSDYARIQGSSLSSHWLTQQSIHHVSRLIEATLQSGAKYIVVQGLPPIGCLPLHISLCPVKAALDHMGCAAAVNAAVMMHNQILQRRLERFRSLYPHCHILYADYWNAYLTIKMNLQKYQFEEPFKPCCGAAGGHFDLHSLCGSPGTVKCNDPSKYISWDGIHLTEAMNRKVTDLFLNQGFCQPSFTELVKSKSGM